MTQLLQNAVYGTALILAVAALRGALKDRLLPEARLALWAVCLFRLFTPAAPASALSFWGLFGRAWELPVSVPAAPAAPSVPTVPVIPAVPAAPSAPAAPTAPPASAAPAAVWIAVGLILAARYALAYARARRAVGRAIPLGREDARYAALPKCARLREGPMDGAPLTFGVVRPTVVLPPGLHGTELACALAHEGVHARRRDNWWHYAAAAALTVFWWDPAVWLMARLIRRDVELSCDRAAVRRLGEDRRAEYANALVTLSTQAEGGAFCHGFGPKRTEERIISIMKYKKATVTGIALTLALVLAVSVGFASDPAADEESTTSSAPAPLVWVGSFGPEGELLKFTIGLDCLEELLAEHVDGGAMTVEGAAYYLETAKALSQDGVKLEWTVPEDIKLFVDKGNMEMTFNIYWLDKNGNKMYLDPVEMLTAYVFAPGDAPSGSGLFIDSAEIEDDFVCYDSTSDPDLVLKEYQAVLDRAVARGTRTRAEAEEMLANMEALIKRVKNGEIEGLMFNRQADGEACYAEELDRSEAGVPDGVPVCTREDCAIQEVHYHDEDGKVFVYNGTSFFYAEIRYYHEGEPVGCPPEAEYRNFEHHESESSHHSDSHH